MHLAIPDVVQKLGQICRAPKLTSRALSLTEPSGETALSVSDPNPSVRLPGHEAPRQGGTQITPHPLRRLGLFACLPITK